MQNKDQDQLKLPQNFHYNQTRRLKKGRNYQKPQVGGRKLIKMPLQQLIKWLGSQEPHQIRNQRNQMLKKKSYYLLKINFTHVYRNLLKVSRSRNKIVMPKLLPKNDPTNLFFYPEKQLHTRYIRLALLKGLATAICQKINTPNLYNCSG